MRCPANQHQNGVQAAARRQNPGDENRALVSHPQSSPVYLPSDLRSTLSSRESTVLIVLRRCVMLFLSTADRGRPKPKEVFIYGRRASARKNGIYYYKGIRAVSDELCRENQLSVVETDGHGKSYGEWKHEKEGSPTLRGMVKADVEVAMTTADSFARFIAELQKMGYAVKYGPKAAHMTVRHKEAQKNIRLDKISPHFSEDSLRRYFRELQTLPPEMQQEYKQQTAPEPPRRQPKEQPMPVRRRARYRGRWNRGCRKITGFMACYYRYCALLRKAYKGKVGKRCYYLLRDDFLKYNRYRRQCDLLWERQITTLDELLTYKENLQAEYDSLTAQRRALYRKKSKTTPADYSEQIQAITARIRELRREITTCADIEMDCGMVQDKVQRAKQPEKAELRVAENTHYNHVCAYGSHH